MPTVINGFLHYYYIYIYILLCVCYFIFIDGIVVVYVSGSIFTWWDGRG
jgi:hypothetical protein